METNGIERPDTDKVESAKREKRSPYGLISCAQAATDTVIERFGRKSTACIEAIVPILSTGMILSVTIWARLTNRADGSGQEVNFEAGVPKGVKLSGDPLQAFKNAVHSAANAWNGYDKATEAAASRLLGVKSTDKTVVTLRPRLVKAKAVSEPPAAA